MARTSTTAPASPVAASQFKTRGYIITEDNDLALKDLGQALDAVATLCDERQDDLPEIPGEMWGALFRTFARQAQAIHRDAAFSNSAMAAPRDLN